VKQPAHLVLGEMRHGVELVKFISPRGRRPPLLAEGFESVVPLAAVGGYWTVHYFSFVY
jgi:hypothetical protein